MAMFVGKDKKERDKKKHHHKKTGDKATDGNFDGFLTLLINA